MVSLNTKYLLVRMAPSVIIVLLLYHVFKCQQYFNIMHHVFKMMVHVKS